MTILKGDVRLFHESLDRATASGNFVDNFYDGFMKSDKNVSAFFSNTDMDRLKRKLKSSLHMITMLVDDTPGADMYMEHLAKVHHKYMIPAPMYEVWLDALIASVQKNDTEFTPELEQVWRRVIGKGIDVMSAAAKPD